MKRVRIVAIAAVALGAAVTAGTRFQQARELSLERAAPGAVSVAAAVATRAPAADGASVTSLAALAPDAAPLAAPVAAAEPVVATTEADAAPAASLMQASVVPPVVAAVPEATPVADAETLRMLAEARPEPAAPAPLDPELQAGLNACAVWLVVTPAAGAMLETSVYAPCDGDAVVSISHAGLTFDTRIGADGQMMLQVPALTEEATVTMTFADGRVESDTTPVSDLAALERVALQWQGPATLLLHAYEFGALYGEPGHIHVGAPQAPGVPGQGFLTVLGDPAIDGAHLAQVYSYPRGETPRNGQVTLEIEAPITEASCGQSLAAHTIELHGTVSAQVRQIRVDMPECDGNGGYVVLPGVLPELQIALN